MNFKSKPYLGRVMLMFVFYGPLLGFFPLVAVPWALPALWIVGVVPALLAGLYYFILTCSWYDRRLPMSRFMRLTIFALIGGVSGILAMITYLQSPFLQVSVVRLLAMSLPFSLSVGAIGGAGAAIFVAQKYGKPTLGSDLATGHLPARQHV